jgi:5-methylcytosine-specific restriction endonuclease McrA
MRLGTLKKVFRKYGKDISIRDELGGVVAKYETPKGYYERPRKFLKPTYTDSDTLIRTLTYRIGRGIKILNGICKICGSEKNIEVHHVKHLRKTGKSKKDFLTTMMIKMNRKQIPLCSNCHRKVHSGEYDGT